jgi:hypothetical protein
VPNSGVLYLNAGQVAVSAAGERLTATATLIGISVSVDVADATNSYDFEVVSDPAGAPAVLGTLALASGSTTAVRRDLSVAIGSAVLIGVRANRTAGSGNSNFSNIIVVVEISIP